MPETQDEIKLQGDEEELWNEMEPRLKAAINIYVQNGCEPTVDRTGGVD